MANSMLDATDELLSDAESTPSVVCVDDNESIYSLSYSPTPWSITNNYIDGDYGYSPTPYPHSAADESYEENSDTSSIQSGDSVDIELEMEERFLEYMRNKDRFFWRSLI